MSTVTAQHAAARYDHSVPARAGYALIVATFGLCGLWAALAPLDSAAVAQGQIEVDSHRKAIQHLEGGIVREINVAEARMVKAGDVLFRLEPTQARANSDLLRKQLNAALAQEARLRAELDGRSAIAFPDELLAARARPDAAAAIEDETRQFLERGQSVDNQVRALEARLAQAQHDLSGHGGREIALEQQVASITTQIEVLRPATEKGLYARNRLLEQEREKARLTGELSQARADMARLAQQQQEIRVQIEQLRQKFREDAAHDLADARNRLAETRQKLVIAGDVLDRIEIRAPVAGIVQNLKVAGIGSVVKAGETIAELVPLGDELVIAAQVTPLDIDSVAAGQKAEIRFSSLSRRQTPTVFGRVQSVSADAIPGEANKPSYYLARVVIDRTTMPQKIAAKLSPGMPADVLIVTGERSALDYFVGPLRTMLAKAMREE